MRTARVTIVSAAVLLLTSCVDKPKIAHDAPVDTTSVVDDRFRDSTKMVVSELPVKFDSTDVLLFPIRLVDLEARSEYSGIGSSSYGSSDIGSGYFNKDNFYGDFINIVFQDASGKERKLTDKRIKIRSAELLRDLMKSTKTAYLLYSIFDRDSNGDGELSNSDLEALYISRIDGSGFEKLSRELHEFYDWRLIKGDDTIYFRTLEDQNKDGKLNNQDRFHYYLINFAEGQYSVTEYNPVKLFE